MSKFTDNQLTIEVGSWLRADAEGVLAILAVVFVVWFVKSKF